MRLIDADANREDFMERVYDILLDEPDNIKANLIIDAFDEMPTAYDPDKVVEQLENERKFWEHSYDRDLGKEKARSYAHAIEIVEGGGADEMEE